MDFFSDMVVNITLDAHQCTAGTVPALPAYIGAADQATTSTSKTSGLVNAGTGVYTKYVHEYVDAAGVVQTVGAAATNFSRYAEYAGARLFKAVTYFFAAKPVKLFGNSLKTRLLLHDRNIHEYSCVITRE